ncbi:MAG: homocysteine S-methyltransferase family protein [Bacteroidaceae bacterium]|nr:homocysteine S-methyltransferase family protein [Bacteroidaceae bacterium]
MLPKSSLNDVPYHNIQMTDKIQILDGSQGSYLSQISGSDNLCVALLNLTAPELVQRMHREYIEAGSQYISTNTFELNPVKWAGHEQPWQEVAAAAIDNARKAIGTRTDVKLMFDVSTGGQLMQPVGSMSFQEAYDNYRQVAEFAYEKVDGFLLETFSDLYELRAAVLAVKDVCDKPVFASMTFDDKCRTLTGSTPEIVALTLSSLGVDALGVNCSSDPELVLEVVRRMKPFAQCPILAEPNKGLPRMTDGRVFYDFTDTAFADVCRRIVQAGATYIGGCCGSTPSSIKAISNLKELDAPMICEPDGTYICSSTVLLKLGKGAVCGERLNPTGKKKLKEALANGNFDYLKEEALAQKQAGAQYLDLNCGIPAADEKSLLCQAVQNVQEVCDLPLQLDSSSPAAIAAAVRVCNGVPMINSVNGSQKSMDDMLPLIARYRLPAVTLPLDDNGVPDNVIGRMNIANRIELRASGLGIDRRQLVFDGLVMAVSSDQRYGNVTLETISQLHAAGFLTTIGLSNVSFGLPDRPTLNRNFLAMAIYAGLDMPIMNPLDRDTMATLKAAMALTGNDQDCKSYIDFNNDSSSEAQADTLHDVIVNGDRSRIAECLERELPQYGKDGIINEVLIPALNKVGDGFAAGKLFMPQLIRSAQAAKEAFELLARQYECADTAKSKATLMMATVHGDVHDIGKNIVGVVVQSHGYGVIDLGKDVSKEDILEAALKEKPQAIGLSALMTTTVESMRETIGYLRAYGVTCPVIVGGAVLTEQIAKTIGADYYAKDALEAARIFGSLL